VAVTWYLLDTSAYVAAMRGLAASAMQHGLKILTTDGHFGRIVQTIAEIHETSS